MRSNLPAVLFPQATAGDAPSARSAMALVDVFASVAVYARLFSLLPIHAYRRTPAGRERVTDSRLAGLLRSPAPGVSAAGWRGYLGSTLALYGEAFIGLYRDGGEVSQLGLLQPERVEVSYWAACQRSSTPMRSGGASR
jgi:phage portal protein BeeE